MEPLMYVESSLFCPLLELCTAGLSLGLLITGICFGARLQPNDSHARLSGASGESHRHCLRRKFWMGLEYRSRQVISITQLWDGTEIGIVPNGRVVYRSTVSFCKILCSCTDENGFEIRFVKNLTRIPVQIWRPIQTRFRRRLFRSDSYAKTGQ